MRVRLAIVAGIGLVLLAGLVVGLSWLPIIRVQSVDVSGAQSLSTSTIESFADAALKGRDLLVFPRDNIFFYPKKQIQSGLLSNFPELSSASVRAENFQTIEVAVAEREPAALWCGQTADAASDCRLMDASGFAYASDALLNEPSLVRYEGEATTTKGYVSSLIPLQFLTPAEFKPLSALVSALDQNQQAASIDEVEVDGSGDVHAHFSNGFTLLFALSDAGGDVFQRFMLALASEPFLNKTVGDFDYLDLRFGDKLYYKLKGK